MRPITPAVPARPGCGWQIRPPERHDGPDPLELSVGSGLTMAQPCVGVGLTGGHADAVERDHARPDGPRSVLLGISLIQELGRMADIGPDQGIAAIYGRYLDQLTDLRG